jgi:hypothetical protein
VIWGIVSYAQLNAFEMQFECSGALNNKQRSVLSASQRIQDIAAASKQNNVQIIGVCEFLSRGDCLV